jgi:hypothetical protein
VLWDEVDVEAAVSNAELVKRMASALGVSPSSVEVRDRIEEKTAPSTEVLIEATRRKGQFPLRLGIYFVGKKTLPSDRPQVQEAIARALDSRVLVSDAGVDPYTRTAIDPQGNRTSVKLDVDALDSRDELRLDERLVLKSSAGAEAELDPARSLVVGRSIEGGLEVHDLGLSRHHFELRFIEGAWVVEDLKSASGTYVNDRLARGPTRLSRGDRIKAGRTVFTLS